MKNEKKDAFMIRVTILAMVTITTLFIISEFFDGTFALAAAYISEVIESVRSPFMIIQLLAIATLFVDLVVRFDNLNEKWRTMHIIAVGYCFTGFMFQVFVFYMDSAFLA